MPVNKGLSVPEPTPEKPKENKKIFKYHNGIKEIYADPFELDWRMQNEVKMKPNIDTIDSWLAPTPDADGNFDSSQIALLNDAYHFYVPVLVKVFKLKAFDEDTGEGMTASEIIDLWAEYLGWKYDLKKNTV